MEQMLLADNWIEKQVKHKVSCSVAAPNIRSVLASYALGQTGLPDVAVQNNRRSHMIQGSELSQSVIVDGRRMAKLQN